MFSNPQNQSGVTPREVPSLPNVFSNPQNQSGVTPREVPSLSNDSAAEVTCRPK